MHRFVKEEAKKQDNIEQVTRKAIPDLSEQSRPQEIEDDWVINFFDKCRLISDAQMQAIWAKVLSGQANSPGNFSKRTVNLLASLDRSDAELFSKLCSFCWLIGSEIVPLIYHTDDPLYSREGIYFATLKHLDDIGLIRFENLSGYAMKWQGPTALAAYYGRVAIIMFDPRQDCA